MIPTQLQRFGHGFCGNTSGVADENTLYGYDDHRLTHQPRVIFDFTTCRTDNS